MLKHTVRQITPLSNRSQSLPGQLALLLSASLLASSGVFAKPIVACGTSASSPSCVATPTRLEAPVPLGTIARAGTPDIAPTPVPSEAGAASSGSAAVCAQLRGAHEAERTLLQSVQDQVRDGDRRHAQMRRTVNSLRQAGTRRGQLQTALARLTEVRSVLAALQLESEKRSRSFNDSMNALNEACLRGG